MLVGGLGALLLALSGCGGGSSATAVEENPAELLAGTLAVDNRTPWDLEIAWLWHDEQAGTQIRRMIVPAGQVLGLYDDPLQAGTELVLGLVLQVSPETGPRVRRKARVQIDGDVIVVVQASGDYPFDVVIGGASTVEP